MFLERACLAFLTIVQTYLVGRTFGAKGFIFLCHPENKIKLENISNLIRIDCPESNNCKSAIFTGQSKCRNVGQI